MATVCWFLLCCIYVRAHSLGFNTLIMRFLFMLMTGARAGGPFLPLRCCRVSWEILGRFQRCFLCLSSHSPLNSTYSPRSLALQNTGNGYIEWGFGTASASSRRCPGKHPADREYSLCSLHNFHLTYAHNPSQMCVTVRPALDVSTGTNSHSININDRRLKCTNKPLFGTRLYLYMAMCTKHTVSCWVPG